MKKILNIIAIVLFMTLLSACDIELAPPKEELTENPFVPTVPVDETIPEEVLPINIESFDRLFNDDVAKSLTIHITSNEWNTLDQTMIDYHKQFGSYKTDEYARAKLVYEDNQGVIEIDDIGFRTRGNLSRVRIQDDQGNLNLSHFKISFKEDFNDVELKSNKKRTVFNLEEMDMKYNRNWDSTYITEKFSLDLFRNFGVYAQYTTLAKVYIQIDDAKHFYGLYTLFEPIDQLFLERRMPIEQTEGDLYKSLWQNFGPAPLQDDYQAGMMGIKDESINYRPSYDLKTNKKTSAHENLITFIDNINNYHGITFKNYIKDHFDVDRLLRLLAVGVLLGNPDDYRAMGNNYYLYHNPVLDQWTMIPYDYDHGLGQGWDGSPIFSDYTIGADIYDWGNLNAHMLNREDYPHPLTDKVLLDREYQILYETYLGELIDPENEYFSFETFYDAYDKQKQFYKDDVSLGMMNQGFGRRNTEWYFNSKVADIEAQLAYYKDNPRT
ncbi:MAG: CotH kinase family protein [Acholeplasmataceae bacterium]|jgi:spore coat protein CotH|nr:CotH kinase family protein [Acholeplasmataceae bacterium]